MEFSEPTDPIALYLLFEKVLVDFGFIRACRGGLANDVDALSNVPTLQLFDCFPSPIVSQLALLDDNGSHRKLLRLWLQGNASMTCLIQRSISGQ
jgi:hypothetical protein